MSSVFTEQLACDTGGTHLHEKKWRVRSQHERPPCAAHLPAAAHSVQLAGNRGIAGLLHPWPCLARGPRGRTRPTAARDGQADWPGWCPSSDTSRRHCRRHRRVRFGAVVFNTTKKYRTVKNKLVVTEAADSSSLDGWASGPKPRFGAEIE